MFWWIFGILAFLYAVIFVYKTKTGSPYVPSNHFQIEVLTNYIKKGDVVADMGCGDGRVLISLIKAGARQADGWEIEPLVWLKAWYNVRLAKMESKIDVKLGDMWRADLSKYDVVFVYQLEQFAPKFVEKAKREMKSGSLVIANTYPLEGLSLVQSDGPLLIYKM